MLCLLQAILNKIQQYEPVKLVVRAKKYIGLEGGPSLLN